MSADNSDGRDELVLDVGSRTISLQAVISNADKMGINYEALPKVPIWGPIFGYTNRGVKLNSAARVMALAANMKREPTQAEKDAISYHTAKAYVTRAYAPPVTLAVTYGFWRRGFATYRFPFHQPKPPRFNPLRFFFLQGNNAHWAWHGARFFLYGTFAHMAIGGVFFSYAMSVYIANMAGDPRMHDFRKTMREDAGLPQHPGQRGPPPMQRGGQGARENSRRGFGTYGDASPVSQSASYSQDEDAAGRAFSGFARETDDQDKESMEDVVKQPRTRASAFPSRQYKSESSQSFSEDDSDPFDDASPVAPSERQSGARQTSYAGSAWDRIRNQANPQGNAQRPPPTSSWAQRRQEEEQTSRGAQDGTSYNYAQSDEDKSYAKSQAQKEFDEMIERERQGESDARRRG